MTNKDINKLADLLFDKIMERQDAFDSQYHEQVSLMMDQGYSFDGLSTEEFYIGEYARLQTILALYEDKEMYEKAAVVLKKVKDIEKKLGLNGRR